MLTEIVREVCCGRLPLARTANTCPKAEVVPPKVRGVGWGWVGWGWVGWGWVGLGGVGWGWVGLGGVGWGWVGWSFVVFGVCFSLRSSWSQALSCFGGLLSLICLDTCGPAPKDCQRLGLADSFREKDAVCCAWLESPGYRD